jgi:hypothetical protein
MTKVCIFNAQTNARVNYLHTHLFALVYNGGMEEKPKKAGRPPKRADRLKKPRNLSFTDAEYDRLGEMAEAAGMSRSELIVAYMKLDMPPF